MRRYEGAIGWNIPLSNDYFSSTVRPDGQLTGFVKKKDLSYPVSQTAALADFCHKNGIPFFVVLAPSKFAPGDAYDGVLDFSNENANDFLRQLQGKDVRCIDLRPFLDAQVSQHADLFFRTDHHWTPEAARLAAQKLETLLNDEAGYSADPSLLDAGQYTESLYPAQHLGSYGQRLTLVRTQPDDFSLFYPKFETSFRLQIPSMELDHTGDFSSLYYMDQLALSHGYYDSHVYGTYSYGERAFLSIQNLEKSDGHKLLLLRDSFGNTLIQFLALGMERLIALDLRAFTGSVHACLQQERPDAVILIYTISEFNWDEMNQKSLFDFR